MSNSSSGCWSINNYNPVPGLMENLPASREYERGFACDLMLKDLRLALEAAREANCKIELGNKSEQIYDKIVRDGYAKKDFSFIYDLIVKRKA